MKYVAKNRMCFLNPSGNLESVDSSLKDSVLKVKKDMKPLEILILVEYFENSLANDEEQKQ